jgi:hypothetical protein
MWALTNRVKTEVSGLGIMHPDDPCYVMDIFILEQECSGSTTIMKESALLDFQMRLFDEGINPVRVSLWWHSHADMSVFMSGTDESQVERFSGDGLFWSVVTNKKGEILVRADIRTPHKFTWNKCGHVVDYETILEQSWVEEAEKCITILPAAHTVSKGSYSLGGNYRGYITPASRTFGRTQLPPTKTPSDTPEENGFEYLKNLGGSEATFFSLPCLDEAFMYDIIDRKEAAEAEALFLANETTEKTIRLWILMRTRAIADNMSVNDNEYPDIALLESLSHADVRGMLDGVGALVPQEPPARNSSKNRRKIKVDKGK